MLYCLSCFGFSLIGVAIALVYTLGYVSAARLANPVLIPWWLEVLFFVLQGGGVSHCCEHCGLITRLCPFN